MAEKIEIPLEIAQRIAENRDPRTRNILAAQLQLGLIRDGVRPTEKSVVEKIIENKWVRRIGLGALGVGFGLVSGGAGGTLWSAITGTSEVVGGLPSAVTGGIAGGLIVGSGALALEHGAKKKTRTEEMTTKQKLIEKELETYLDRMGKHADFAKKKPAKKNSYPQNEQYFDRGGYVMGMGIPPTGN